MSTINFQIEEPAVLNYVSQSYQDELLSSLKKNEFTCYLFNGSKVYDKESFLTEIGINLLDCESINGWDEFEDLYLSWLVKDGQTSSALVWSHVHQMLEGNLADLIEIADILTGIARKLYAREKIYLSFFLGEGSNFPEPSKL